MASLTPTPYAQQIANATDRGDARYFVGPGSGLTQVGTNWTDGTYTYDSNGLSLDRPNQFVPGIGSASDSDSYDPWTGRYGASSGGGGGGGFGPGFDQMMADLNAQSVSDKASRDAAIKRSFINFGLNNFDLSKAAATTGIGDLASILDQGTLDTAKNNKFSVMARIQQALEDQQRSNRINLRQRGGVRSGESGFLAQRAQTGFDTNVYDSTQKLLDYISGAQQGYAQAERARQMALWQSLLNRPPSYNNPPQYQDRQDRIADDWFAPLANVAPNDLLRWAQAQSTPTYGTSPSGSATTYSTKAANALGARGAAMARAYGA